jgi:hypothetical protein
MSEGLLLTLVYAGCAVMGSLGLAGWILERRSAERRIDEAYREGFDDGSHDLVTAPAWPPSSGRHAAQDATVALRVYADMATPIFEAQAEAGEPWPGATARVDALAETYYRIMRQSLCHACGSPTCPAAGKDTVDECPLWQDAEQRDYWLPTIPGQLFVEGPTDA